jgi:hypothetical protein
MFMCDQSQGILQVTTEVIGLKLERVDIPSSLSLMQGKAVQGILPEHEKVDHDTKICICDQVQVKLEQVDIPSMSLMHKTVQFDVEHEKVDHDTKICICDQVQVKLEQVDIALLPLMQDKAVQGILPVKTIQFDVKLEEVDHDTKICICDQGCKEL